MPLPTHFTLNNGLKTPSLGLGTWQSKPNEVENAVEVALKAGYRYIDAAAIYGNEVEVGNGIKGFRSSTRRNFRYFKSYGVTTTNQKTLKRLWTKP